MKLPVPSSQLKKILVDENLVSVDNFDAIVTEAERKNQNILDILVSQKVVTLPYVENLIARLLSVDIANLALRKPQEEVVRMLPEEIARQRQVIIFAKEPDGALDVAMADPSDLETVEFLRQRYGVRIKPFLATADDLNLGFSVYGFKSTGDFKKDIEDNIRASLLSHGKKEEDAAAELPIVAIVDNIISYAISLRASDIHLEILETETMIRYRIDGILHEVMRIPKAVHNVLVTRIKILAGLKIDEHTKPQDGRFREQIGTDMIDIRVSVMPTFYGEKVEMRILESAQKPLSLEELGMLPEMAAEVGNSLKRSYGMDIVCGPTGSGKTTTLYAIMNILNRSNVNIVTIEDPIEYNMRYVNQSQINPQAGITFASGLRAILRQDPNIIMVGEIRDQETADIAVQASLTGHLLLSSLHTNDAPTAVPRLFDLGVQPFLVSSVLNMVLAQRLVRRICTSCVYSVEVGDDVKRVIEDQLKSLPQSSAKSRVPKVFYKGKGCSVCGGTGYRGRLGIFEILNVDEKIKSMIIEPQFSLDNLRKAQIEAGGSTMFEDGLLKIELGLTTIEEVLRVIKE